MKPNLNLLYIGNTLEYFNAIHEKEELSLIALKNSLEAIHHLKSKAPIDAIICNFNLPGNNGLYLFDWIRERQEFDKIPFILLSKEFSVQVYKDSFLKGVNDYYVYPITPLQNILNRIEFLCKHRDLVKSREKPKSTEEVYKMPLSKRIFDVIVASSVLLLASPFLLIIIAAIRLESKGKVYYISKRVGRKTFDFYKLRSMRTGSDALLKKLAKEKNQYKKEDAAATKGPFDTPCPRCSKLPEGQTCSPTMYIDTHEICDYWFNIQKKEAAKNNSTFVKIVNDPRVTKVGKFIRNTSIDELPQLINVLKGDMSIVGNRPLPVYEAETLTADALSKRFLAPPGITGLWQVELRGKGGDMSEEERMRLDNEYADHFKGDNYSFWYDFKLILRTIPALLQKDSV
ncbi:sugar transferase [Algibacter pacificus]|uniref:sugar transferase n=1 Tax=Algibacter pacificus TaxID=2599389 RepID=UPI0011CC5741|nr:sugar transferase [Algibacter pacificus]